MVLDAFTVVVFLLFSCCLFIDTTLFYSIHSIFICFIRS